MTQAEIREEKRIKWNERLHEAETSGLTIKEWCRKNGIQESTFYYRKRQKKLREQNAATLLSREGEEIPSPCFAELNIAFEKDSLYEDNQNTSNTQEPEFLLQIQDCQIAVSHDFQEEDLGKIVQVLRHV